MFSKDFIWGAASASYQIEGGWNEDGKGLSIWDVFAHKNGNIQNNENGDTACDSYHRYQEDADLLKKLGVDAYRFSISWPRIFPNGDGRLNKKGLAYYDRLVDALLERGITPYATLFHWDLPYALQVRGGWMNPETADAFSKYAAAVCKHFKGRIHNYFTLNEPQCVIRLGHCMGIHAPGKKYDTQDALLCMHQLLLAHGKAVRAMRETDADAEIGIASTGMLAYPEKDTEENIKSAEKACFVINEDTWSFSHNWVLDPIILGAYPQNCGGEFARFIRRTSKEDLKIIHQKTDMLGVNVYNGFCVDEKGNDAARKVGAAKTALKWPFTPEVMHYGITALDHRYQLPIFITENGQSCNDRIFLDGAVHDPDRIDFLQRYLSALEKAVNDGAQVKGYFHWSLTDNLEWNSGYSDRFGLVYIDFESCERIPKDSFVWYRDLIRKGKHGN